MKTHVKIIVAIVVVTVITYPAFITGVFFGEENQRERDIAETYESNDAFEYGLFNMVNEARSPELHSLERNTCLDEKARERAKQIVESEEFSHTNSNGEQPFKGLVYGCFTELDRESYSKDAMEHAAENLASDYETHYVAHANFMNSATHMKNIMSEKYSSIGIGCYGENHVCVEFFYGVTEAE